MVPEVLDIVVRIKIYILIIVMGWSLRALAMTEEAQQRFLYYFYEAEQLWQQQDYAASIPLFEFCHDLNPTDPIVNRYMGHAYRGCNMPDRALPFYRVAWEQAPNDCWADYAVSLYNMGDKKHRKQAIKVMEQTTKTLTNDIELWDRLRDAYTGLGKYKQAIKAQDRMDQIEGYGPYSAINRYRIYVMANDPKRAIRAIEEYLQEDSTNLQFQLYRMHLYEITRKPFEQQEQAYLTVLRLDPHNALALNDYAYMLACHGGDLKKAESMSIRALHIEPTNPAYLDTYAWIMYLSGQKELAKLYIRQAMQHLPADADKTDIQRHYNIIMQ